MTIERIKGIYLIERMTDVPTDNEPQYYVGQAGDIFERWSQHCINREQYIDKEIEKYGRVKFIFRILEEVSKDMELNECETKWIKYYKDTYNEKKMYNLSQTNNSNPHQLPKEIKSQIKELFNEDIARSIYAISEYYNVAWGEVVKIRKPLLKAHGLKYDNKIKNIIDTTTGKTPNDWRGNRVTQSLSAKILKYKEMENSNKDISLNANISITDLELFLSEYQSGYDFANDLLNDS